MLEDLSTLPVRRLEKELAALAHDALPCAAVTVFDCDADEGLTVDLHVGSRRRGDVLDLGRVVEDDPAVDASCGWSVLPPGGGRSYSQLLLRVSFDRPVHCTFTVSFDVTADPSNPLREALPLLLAADGIVFTFDGRVDSHRPLVWIAAPVAREPVFELLSAVGV